MSFWETVPGAIASWGAALVALGVIGRWLWRGFKITQRITKTVLRLIEIGDEDAWPNGSKTLPQSVTTIYNRLEAGVDRFDQLDQAQARNYELLEAYIKTHRQDHEILNRPA